MPQGTRPAKLSETIEVPYAAAFLEPLLCTCPWPPWPKLGEPRAQCLCHVNIYLGEAAQVALQCQGPLR